MHLDNHATVGVVFSSRVSERDHQRLYRSLLSLVKLLYTFL